MRRRPIGQILVEKGEISEVDLEAALAEQERSGRRLGEILIEQGRTSWLALARAIAEQVLDIQRRTANRSRRLSRRQPPTR
jgi:type IV pilus assembly protein PilB